MAKYKGKVVRSDLEGGFWTLEAEDGTTYKLEGGGADLLKGGVRAEVDGAVEEVMGIGFGAPVSAVKKYKILVIGSALHTDGAFAMKFELKHTFDAPPQAVIDAMTDPAFPEFMKAHMKLMSDIKPIDRKEQGDELSWRLRCVPVPMIKKVGPKEVPPEALAFVQESTIDRAAKRISFKNVAEHPTVKKHLESSGSFGFRDIGGRTERTISGELKVTNLPFLLKPLGPIAERIIYSNAQDLLNEEAKVFGEFLKQRQPAA